MQTLGWADILLEAPVCKRGGETSQSMAILGLQPEVFGKWSEEEAMAAPGEKDGGSGAAKRPGGKKR